MGLTPELTKKIQQLVEDINNLEIVSEEQAYALDETGESVMTRLARLLTEIISQYSTECDMNINHGAIMVAVMNIVEHFAYCLYTGGKVQITEKNQITISSKSGEDYVDIIAVATAEAKGINFLMSGDEMGRRIHGVLGTSQNLVITAKGVRSVLGDESSDIQRSKYFEASFAENGLWDTIRFEMHLNSSEERTFLGIPGAAQEITQTNMMDGSAEYKMQLFIQNEKETIYLPDSAVKKRRSYESVVDLCVPDIPYFNHIIPSGQDTIQARRGVGRVAEKIIPTVFEEIYTAALEIYNRKNQL